MNTLLLGLQPLPLQYLSMPFAPRLQNGFKPRGNIQKPRLRDYGRLQLGTILVPGAPNIKCPKCTCHVDKEGIMCQMHAAADSTPGAVCKVIAKVSS